MISEISPKQLNAILNSNRRINVWEGAVRSGKTFSSIIRFIKELRSGPPGAAMIVGVSRAALQRNILPELCNLLGIPIPTPKAEALNLLNRTVHLVGASDERAQSKIQGSTLATAYVDETTLIPEGFFKMLLSRLSVPGAKLFCTTNPGSPMCWLKTQFLDNKELDLCSFAFRLEDNPALTKEYVDSLKREYQGIWYDRYVEGKWVLADGLVYGNFDESTHVIPSAPGPAEYYVVGCDAGTTNPTAFVLVGYNPKYFPNMWVEKEYHWDSRTELRQKTNSEYADDMKAFIRDKNVRAVYIDPSAASLKLEFSRSGIRSVMDADNDVLNGISFTASLLGNGTLKILSSCKNLIKEIQSYRWDSRASERGVDKPIKENDHVLDSLRYVLKTHFQVKLGSNITSVDIDNAYNKACGFGDQDLPSFYRGVPQINRRY